MGAPDGQIDADHLAWEFERLGRGPVLWFLSAQSLYAAAELTYVRYRAALQLQTELYYRDENGIPRGVERRLAPDEVALLPEIRLGPVTIMLLGLSIENLAKGWLVHLQPDLVDRGQGLKPKLKDHRLERLVASCDGPLAEEEVRALRLISGFVTWAGRYPTPAQPMKPEHITSNPGPPVQSQPALCVALWEHGRRVRNRIGAKFVTEYPGLVL